jgi:hypothetical protein
MSHLRLELRSLPHGEVFCFFVGRGRWCGYEDGEAGEAGPENDGVDVYKGARFRVGG